MKIIASVSTAIAVLLLSFVACTSVQAGEQPTAKPGWNARIGPRHVASYEAEKRLRVVPEAASAVVPSHVTPRSPCRAYDSRTGSAPPIPAGSITLLQLRGVCGIPVDANAVSLNVHALSPGPAGFVVVFAGCESIPAAATLGAASTAGESSGTLAILDSPPGECFHSTEVYNSGLTHLAIDVTGWTTSATSE